MAQSEMKQGARIFDTRWLDKYVSLTDGDYHSTNKLGGIISFERKNNTPIVNAIQLTFFQCAWWHIVVMPGKSFDKYLIEYDEYKVWCPHRPFKIRKVDRGRELLTDEKSVKGYANPITIKKSVIKQTFEGLSPWACCGRWDIDPRVVREWRNYHQSERNELLVGR